MTGIYAATPWKVTRRPPAMVARLVRKCTKHARHSGSEATLAVLKDSLSRARQCWLEDKPFHWAWLTPSQKAIPTTLVAQLSMCKRALPLPSEREVAKMISAHKEALLSEFRSSPEVLARARRFACRWAKKRLRDGPTGLGNLSRSACWERTRKEGGQASAMHSLRSESLDRLEQNPCYVGARLRAVRKAGLISLSRQTQAASPSLGQPYEMAFRQCTDYALCFREVTAMVNPPARVEVVKELGMKARIVTKSPVALATLAHGARRRILAGLRRDPRVGKLLDGDFDAALQRFVGAQGQVLSSDFKSASDLLPLDLCRAIVDGLILSDKFTTGEAVALQTVVRGVECHWPDKVAITRRGILMGCPTTWGLLNICHLFWWAEALRGATKGERRASRFSCFGDDALIVAPPSVLSRYNRAVTAGGMVLSPGKHALTRARGVYLEHLLEIEGPRVTRSVWEPAAWRVTYRDPKTGESRKITRAVRRKKGPTFCQHRYDFWRGRQVDRLRVEPSIPLRGVLWPDGSEFGAGGRKPEQPLWVTAGATVEAMAAQFGPARVFRAQRLVMRPFVEWALRRGLPSLPRALGGSGFLASEQGNMAPIQKVASRAVRRAIGVLATQPADRVDPASFTRLWGAVSAEVPGFVFDEFRDTNELAVYGRALPFGPLERSQVGRPIVRDLRKRLELELLTQVSLASDAGGMVRTPWRAHDLVTRYHRTLQAVLSTWAGVRPVEGSIQYWMERISSRSSDSRWLLNAPDVIRRMDPSGEITRDEVFISEAMVEELRSIFEPPSGPHLALGKALLRRKISPLSDEYRRRTRTKVESWLGGLCFERAVLPLTRRSLVWPSGSHLFGPPQAVLGVAGFAQPELARGGLGKVVTPSFEPPKVQDTKGLIVVDGVPIPQASLPRLLKSGRVRLIGGELRLCDPETRRPIGEAK